MTVEQIDTDTIGGRVRKLRKEKGWTQTDLGEKLGQNWASIKNKELGYNGRSFNVDELIALSDLFNVTLDELIRGVKTENVDVYRRMGLEDKAIMSIRLHNMVWVPADPDADPPIEKDITYIAPDPSLNAALASTDILQAISDYMSFKAETDGKAIGRVSAGKGYVDCRMSEGMYEAVLGQNLLRIMDAVKRGEEIKPVGPEFMFDAIEEGGADGGEEE